MKVITSINAKGGCGKSTIASNVAAGLARAGHPTLLIDLDPQAQIKEWYQLGDQYNVRDSITGVLAGQQTLAEVVQRTHLPNLAFVSSSSPLEELGQRLRNVENYHALLLRHLRTLGPDIFDYCVIDSPNQVSPVMDNAIYATDLFLIPVFDPHSMRSYPNVHLQIKRLRPEGDYQSLHVLNGLSKQHGKRNAVLAMVAGYQERYGITPAQTEVRHCAYLGQVDLHGGSIFEYVPSSNGAADIAALVEEVREQLDPDIANLDTPNHEQEIATN